MQIFRELTNPKIARLLKQGAIGVIPTDTLYGIVASAANPQAVARLYEVRQRSPSKACIVLVGSRDQIKDTDAWRPVHWRASEKYWPGPVSMVLPTTDKTPAYLHHGDQSPPLRIPDYPELRALLARSGPVIAPSANPEGKTPAATVDEAIQYFGETIDFYVDGGRLAGQPSTLITFGDDKIVMLRQGAGVIDPDDLA